MIAAAAALRCQPSPSLLLPEPGEIGSRRARPTPSRCAPSVVVCSGDSQRRGASSIPKLEPFSRSRIERLVREPTFLQKSENDLTEYCSTLEGDDAYSCWRAYFELKDLKEEMPREDVEKFVRQAGGVKSLIDCLHGLTAMQKKGGQVPPAPAPARAERGRERPFPVPDGLPPTQEELEEEERARMPDSPFTRLLRRRGKLPAWYSQAPDHETD
uniref:Mitochondrial escape protein 2 n=1 Tax=Anthurium amnicola TaxID=1678845 RepID=A0A1D1XG37_9ARAE